MASPYVTVYHNETGKPTLIYRSTLQEFIATGEYSTKAPGQPATPEALKRSTLPAAGREASRVAELDQHAAEHTEAAPEAAEAPEASAPADAAPRRQPPRRRGAEAEA